MKAFRIGQIVPRFNVIMETEIPARAHEPMAEERFAVQSARMRMKAASKEALATMDREFDRCALRLSDAACRTFAMPSRLGPETVAPGGAFLSGRVKPEEAAA